MRRITFLDLDGYNNNICFIIDIYFVPAAAASIAAMIPNPSGDTALYRYFFSPAETGVIWVILLSLHLGNYKFIIKRPATEQHKAYNFKTPSQSVIVKNRDNI